ncbi:MAG: FtsX-like permease family protein, partial [Desulfobacterales bacterium]
MILHRPFILSQIRRSGVQALIFVLCVQLSIVSLVAINGFAHNVRQSLLQDTRSLHAGDIIIRSNYPLSNALNQRIEKLTAQGRIQASRVLQFYSLARTLDQRASLLSGVKAVGPGYPFYGQVVLQSGKALSAVLTPGRIVVEQSLLERLGLAVGDSLRLGQGTLTIADVVLREPDRPVTVFSLGPRIFLALAELMALDLVQPGSRVRYKLLVRVNHVKDLDPLLAEIQAAASPDERVDSFETAPSRIKRFFDNLIFFLALMGIMTLLLAGIGIQSTLAALLKRKEQTIAIMKTVGATSRFIALHFMVLVLILGAAGTLLGLISGWGLQFLIPLLFRGILPEALPPVFTAAILAETLFLGLMVVVLFSFLPLNRLRDVKPIAI